MTVEEYAIVGVMQYQHEYPKVLANSLWWISERCSMILLETVKIPKCVSHTQYMIYHLHHNLSYSHIFMKPYRSFSKTSAVSEIRPASSTFFHSCCSLAGWEQYLTLTYALPWIDKILSLLWNCGLWFPSFRLISWRKMFVHAPLYWMSLETMWCRQSLFHMRWLN